MWAGAGGRAVGRSGARAVGRSGARGRAVGRSGGRARAVGRGRARAGRCVYGFIGTEELYPTVVFRSVPEVTNDLNSEVHIRVPYSGPKSRLKNLLTALCVNTFLRRHFGPEYGLQSRTALWSNFGVHSCFSTLPDASLTCNSLSISLSLSLSPSLSP